MRPPLRWHQRLLHLVWHQALSAPPHSDMGGVGGWQPAPGPGYRWSASSLVRLLWALTCGQWPLPRAWLAGCLAHLGPQLPSLSSMDLADLVWAIAKLGVRPPRPWLAALVGTLHAALAPQKAPRPGAGATGGAAGLVAQTGGDCERRGSGGGGGGVLSVERLVGIVWSLAWLGARPAPPLAERILQVTYRRWVEGGHTALWMELVSNIT